MVEAFTLSRASRSGAVFDEDKLRWLNAVYIRNTGVDDLVKRLDPFLREAGYSPDALKPQWLRRVIETVKDELMTLGDIGEHIELFFDDRFAVNQEARALLDTENARKVTAAFGEYLAGAAGEPRDIYAAAIKYAKDRSGGKGRDLFMPLRAALTGKVQGPELDRVFEILGKSSAEKRLKLAGGEGKE